MIRTEINATKQKTVPKSIQAWPSRNSSLTIKDDSVITSGSLTISLEELKQLIKTYEELE